MTFGIAMTYYLKITQTLLFSNYCTATVSEYSKWKELIDEILHCSLLER